MKSLLIVIFVVFFNGTVFADKNKIDGFRDIKWKDSITKYNTVLRLTSDSNKSKKFYIRDDEELYLEDVTLKSVSYVFKDDKFSSAVIQTAKSVANSKAILSLLKKKYGKPAYSNTYTRKFRWEDSSAEVTLKCFSTIHKCSVVYNSLAMNSTKK